MIKIHHINCGTLIVPGYPVVPCHCLLLEEGGRLALVDTGIGLKDVQDPTGRLGQEWIDRAGFQFHESDTAVRRIESLGFASADVLNVFLTHGDPDHAGGLADFPDATVHVSQEERQQIPDGHWRYVATHFAHGPNWRAHQTSHQTWFGMEARAIDAGFDSPVLLIPLIGHTLGHSGYAIPQGDRWLLHVGDAYYLHAELTEENHPASQLAASRAGDDSMRKQSVDHLRRLLRDHGRHIEMVAYHDLGDLPADYPLPARV